MKLKKVYVHFIILFRFLNKLHLNLPMLTIIKITHEKKIHFFTFLMFHKKKKKCIVENASHIFFFCFSPFSSILKSVRRCIFLNYIYHFCFVFFLFHIPFKCNTFPARARKKKKKNTDLPSTGNCVFIFFFFH